MGTYFVKGKGWRYHFKYLKVRYTKAWFKTKKEANKAEAEYKNLLKNPPSLIQTETDTIFLDLINKRLDYMQVYHTKHHYDDCRQMAARWVEKWGDMENSSITRGMIQEWVIVRNKVSAYVANKEIRHLRALFNWGKKEGLIRENPTNGINFLPIDKKIKYIPPKEDVLKILFATDQNTQDYLWAIKETLARMNEINQLAWEDVDLLNKTVTLYTRKKKGGHRTPRKIPMTGRLFDIFSRRFQARRKDLPWVFWHTYWSSKTGEKIEGRFLDRKRIMKTLCKRAGVKYFRFHALRHFGASILNDANLDISTIQRLLGHENRSTTEIYLHRISETEQDAIRILEEKGGSLESVDKMKVAHEVAHEKK